MPTSPTGRLPYLSAVLFGALALPFALAPFALAPDPPAQIVLGAALFAVPAGMLWGYVAGRHAQGRAPSPVRLMWTGAYTTVATGLSTGAGVFVYGLAREGWGPSLGAYDLVDGLVSVLFIALLFSVVAIPFGLAGGLVLEAAVRRAQRQAV